jgi:hypothetical protein
MANKELYVLLSSANVNEDKYLSTWRKSNPHKSGVIVVSVNNVKPGKASKELTKLTLMLTKYETIEEFNQLWRKFKINFNFTGSLQTLHFIFLVEGSESQRNVIDEFTFGNYKFFKNLKCKAIEFDCKFIVPLQSPFTFFPSSYMKNGIRVNLGLTTTSVTVRSPGAQIIQLCNGNRTQFNLERIELMTETYPMGIILCNIPHVTDSKKLDVYWKNGKLKEFLKLGTFWLEKFQSIAGRNICIKLPPPASSDDETLIQPASSNETLPHPPASSNETLPHPPASSM